MKKLCLSCRKAFNMASESLEPSPLKCPECGNQTIIITHRFRPPKTNDKKKWEVVKFLIDNGFPYQHINIYEPDRHGIQRLTGYASYPENMIDAIDFIEKFKSQAYK